MIAVIDYGMGNLRSVQKALEAVGGRVKVTSRPTELAKCDKLVFPGVGAFGDSMKELKRRGLVGPIKDAIAGGKPFLGLCLGLQLLFETSEEAPGVKGLGALKGDVRKFRSRTLKIPHMGWNVITRTTNPAHEARGGAGDERRTTILKGVPNGSYMYFVHSYYVAPKDKSITLTTTDYGIKFISGIRKDNICGFQFHPEKSQALGLRILRNFVRL